MNPHKQRLFFVMLIVVAISIPEVIMSQPTKSAVSEPQLVRLPEPQREGRLSVEEALRTRRSVREFRREPLTTAQLSQLVWAAQGISHSDNLRTAPSAGALYPLELRVVVGQVDGVAPGIYRYQPQLHELSRVVGGDLRTRLARAALEQEWMADAPVVFIISAVYERTTRKYGERGKRYVHMEAGHAAENLALQAVGLGLGTTMVGAFDDREVQQLVQLTANEQPLYLIPVGTPR